jgi:hypothetical protein
MAKMTIEVFRCPDRAVADELTWLWKEASSARKTSNAMEQHLALPLVRNRR